MEGDGFGEFLLRDLYPDCGVGGVMDGEKSFENRILDWESVFVSIHLWNECTWQIWRENAQVEIQETSSLDVMGR